MPTYEYRCDRCGDNLDVFQSFTDKPLRRHAQCGGHLEKVFHPRGVVFKGTGFYVTDSRSKASSDNGDSTPADKESSKSNGSKEDSTQKSKVSTDSPKSD